MATPPAPPHMDPSTAPEQSGMAARLSTATTSRSRSRPASAVAFPAFPSSLPYATVRDFAYPPFHPMHYGGDPDAALSGTTTPGSEWGRRLSDPDEGLVGHEAWGGEGGMFGETEGDDGLPSTRFGPGGEGGVEAELGGGENGEGGSAPRRKRKSKSHAEFSDYERGRRRESASLNNSRGRDAQDMFRFSGNNNSDPAGRETLRQSRTGGQGGLPNTTTAAGGGGGGESTGGAVGGRRRDSHFQTLLPSRSFGPHHAGAPTHPDSDLPLDAEPPPTTPPQQPLRQSIGPEDEDLYAGPSLALYTFAPENANELALREGQVIMVSYRHGQGWLVAEDMETGEQGLVPEAYVRLLSELPHFDGERGVWLEGEEVVGEDGEVEEEEEGEEDGGVEVDGERGGDEGDDWGGKRETPDSALEVEGDEGESGGDAGPRLGSGLIKESRIDEAHEKPGLVGAVVKEAER